jgi:hypothetical protein
MSASPGVKPAHGDAHGLLLEERHAERLAQHLLQFRLGIDHRLPAFAAAEVRMDHVALDRSGPDDRHLHDQVVVGARLQPRQHRHLRPALDLEGADRVGLADHRIGAGILGRDRGEVVGNTLVFRQQVEPLLHAGEHAEREHVDLHELQGVDVVLVPLDDLAVGHGGRLDRYQIVEAVVRQNESSGMLGEVPRCSHQLASKIKRESQPAVAEVQVHAFDLLLRDTFLRPSPNLRGQRLDQILGQPERFTDVAERTLCPVADDGRA